MRDHAATARAAFAMAARAELPEGQRAAALDRGLAIVSKYRLNPDDFDIPGRERKAAPRNEMPIDLTGLRQDHRYRAIYYEYQRRFARRGYPQNPDIRDMTLEAIETEIASRQPVVGMFDDRSIDLEAERDLRLAMLADLQELAVIQQREDRLWQGQRDARWQARCQAHAMGRGRLHVVDPAS